MKVLETRSLMTDRNGFVPADFEPKRMIDKYLVQIDKNRHQDFLSEVRCVSYFYFLPGILMNLNLKMKMN